MSVDAVSWSDHLEKVLPYFEEATLGSSYLDSSFSFEVELFANEREVCEYVDALAHEAIAYSW